MHKLSDQYYSLKEIINIKFTESDWGEVKRQCENLPQEFEESMNKYDENINYFETFWKIFMLLQNKDQKIAKYQKLKKQSQKFLRIIQKYLRVRKRIGYRQQNFKKVQSPKKKPKNLRQQKIKGLKLDLLESCFKSKLRQKYYLQQKTIKSE